MNALELRTRLAALGWSEERLAAKSGVPASSIRLCLRDDPAAGCDALERVLLEAEAARKRLRLESVIRERELIRHARA